MPVKIRLSRKGRTKAPFYHIVAADARAPRDGKFIEKLGTYNPLTKPATVDLNAERAYYWLTQGAQPTETMRSILRFKGVLYRQHLDKGVKKGALTQEAADAKHAEWLAVKEAKIAARFEETAKEKLDWQNKLAGVGYVPKKKVAAVSLDEAAAELASKEPMTLAEEAEAKAAADAPAATEEAAVVTETVVENVGDEDPELAAMNEAAAADKPKEDKPAE